VSLTASVHRQHCNCTDKGTAIPDYQLACMVMSKLLDNWPCESGRGFGYVSKFEVSDQNLLFHCAFFCL